MSDMKMGKTLGFMLFIGGMLLLLFYGIYLGFEDMMEAFDTITIVLTALMTVGFFVLLISILVEQQKGSKENLKDISKEDLKP